jgi:hypothetical protein
MGLRRLSVWRLSGPRRPPRSKEASVECDQHDEHADGDDDGVGQQASDVRSVGAMAMLSGQVVSGHD